MISHERLDALRLVVVPEGDERLDSNNFMQKNYYLTQAQLDAILSDPRLVKITGDAKSERDARRSMDD